MKSLTQHIQEGLRINRSTKKNIVQSEYPKDKDELQKILKERLKKDKDADLNDIDVSKITDMSQLFVFLDPHNIDISGWDVSNVKNMSYMFYDCIHFNCDLSSWNVSGVEDMHSMFESCNDFEGEGLENWKISNKTNTFYIFNYCNKIKNKPSWYKPY